MMVTIYNDTIDSSEDDFRIVWCFVVLATVARGQFMKGSSPVTPSSVLDTCQQQAVARQYNVSRHGQHADVVNLWCSTYQSVVPCIKRTLPTANNANDWFLSLVFNQSKANEVSFSMCRRFPTLSNLTCVENHLREVATCMKWTTTSAISHFNDLYNPNVTPTPEIKLKAFIYACVISDTTAKCFHRKLTSCSPAQRDLLYDYYIMLSGHCEQIITKPKTPTLSETQDNAKIAERKPSPNVDTRPSPLDSPTETVDQSTTTPAGTQEVGGIQEPGGTKTWENSLYPRKNKDDFQNRENRPKIGRVPVRSGNYRNTANSFYQLNTSLAILIGSLVAMATRIVM